MDKRAARAVMLLAIGSTPASGLERAASRTVSSIVSPTNLPTAERRLALSLVEYKYITKASPGGTPSVHRQPIALRCS